MPSRSPSQNPRQAHRGGQQEPDWPIRLVVPIDLARTGDNVLRRLHWAQRSARNGVARGCARAAWVAAGSPRTEGRVRVSLIVRRARALDPANCVGAAKALIDGVFVKGLTPDDSPRYLEIGSVTQETSRVYKDREEVEIVVEPAGEAP